MKKIVVSIFVLIVLFAPISCEDFKLFVDCDKCFTNLSDKYNIEYKVTLNKENVAIPVTLYEGDIDNGAIISQDTVRAQPYYTIAVTFGRHYSAVAKYSDGGRVIFAVDGQKLRKKLDESSCDKSCYTIQGDVLDLRLK